MPDGSWMICERTHEREPQDAEWNGANIRGGFDLDPPSRVGHASLGRGVAMVLARSASRRIMPLKINA